MPRASRSLALVNVIVLGGVLGGLAACGGGGGARPIGSTPPAPSGAFTLVPAPEPGPPPAETLAKLGGSDDASPICFAWSPRGAVMCDVGSSSIQGGATYAVRILGQGADDVTYYQSPEDEQFFDVDPAQIDRAALARATAAAQAGDFRGWNGDPRLDVAIGATTDVAGITVRRTRTVTGQDGDEMTGVWDVSKDVIELRCGDRWVPLALDGDVFGNAVGEPEVTAVRAGSALLLMASVSWGVEGDSGGGRDAALIDPAEVCR